MPQRPPNLRSGSELAQSEYAIGSLPVGSWVELYDLDDVLIYRGVVKDQRTTWGYTVIMPITEGEGNFAGAVETRSLYRLYSMSEQHHVQAERPVVWLGVDEELASELAAGRSGAALKADVPIRESTCISLLPVVSLIPEEVYGDDDHD